MSAMGSADPYGGSMMQNAYPADAAMSTFGGNQAFMGPPPGHGGMQAMESSMMTTKAPKESKHEKGGHGGHEEEHGAAIDKDTGRTPRRCTDVQTCFAFMIYGILALTLLLLAHQHGNTGRLNHGVDYYGRVCGVDPGVENSPFLFWCRDLTDTTSPLTGEPTQLDLTRPSCVPFCPQSTDAAVKIPCLQKEVAPPAKTIGGGQFGNLETRLIQVQESVVQTDPYATTPRGGRYCMPKDDTLRHQVLDGGQEFPMAQFPWFKPGTTGLGSFSPTKMMTVVGSLRHVWWLVFLGCLFSIIFGYFYLYCVNHCNYHLAKTVLWPISFFCIIAGIFWLLSLICICDRPSGACEWYKRDNPFNPLYRQAVLQTQTIDILSITIGVLITSMGLCLFGIAYPYTSSKITDILKASRECFLGVPGLYYLPAAEGLCKFIVFWTGMQGFGVIWSWGEIEKNRIFVDGARFSGLSREWTPGYFDVRFWFMVVFWIFLFHWMMEFCTAMGQFITSFCTFKYWGMKKEGKKKPKVKDPYCVLDGLKTGLVYHVGSILRCALFVPLYRPVRFFMWVSDEIKQGSQATLGGKCINIACCCVLGLIRTGNKNAKEFIQSSDCPIKDGLNDVVIRSNDFDAGSEKAHELLEHSHKVVQIMYRDLAQATLCMIGTFGIAGWSTAIVYMIVTHMEVYYDPSSPLFIAEPILVCFLTFILSAHIAFGFNTLWDHTADCLMYDYTWARRWNRKTVDHYIPEVLVHVVGYDHAIDDRYPYYGKAKANMYLRSWLPMANMNDPKKKAAKDHATKVDPYMTGTNMPPMMGMGQRPASEAGPPSYFGGSNFGSAYVQRDDFDGEVTPLLGPV
jgi:hypothetical protein